MTANLAQSEAFSSDWTVGVLAADVSAASNELRAMAKDENFGQAQNLGTLTKKVSRSDSVGVRDLNDYFRFTVKSAGTLTLELKVTGAPVLLTLYDATRQLIYATGVEASSTVQVSGPLTTGQYFAAVSYLIGTRAASYTLSTSFAAGSTGTTPTTPPPTTPSTPTSPTTSTPSTPTTSTPPSTGGSTPTNVVPLADVPYFGSSVDWSVNAVNAPEAWGQGITGVGITVAVVDTGVDIRHEDLQGSIWVNAREIAGNGRDDDGNGYIDDVNGWDFANGDSSPLDTNGHGTHVAGTIAAQRNSIGMTGVAYGVKVMPVQVLGADGSGSVTSVAAGIRYAVDNGAQIINLSLGGATASTTLLSALQYAQQKNVLVIAASGNESASLPGYPARYSSTLSNVLSVGAYDSAYRIASFSNRVGSSGAVQVDAPGVSIYSTVPNGRYASYSGTSMATPHVAGLAALTWSANRSLSAAAVRNLIVNGTNISVQNSDSNQGVNAAYSVAAALSTSGGTTTTAGNTAGSSTTGGQTAVNSASSGRAVARTAAGESARAWARDVAAAQQALARSSSSTFTSDTNRLMAIDCIFAEA